MICATIYILGVPKIQAGAEPEGYILLSLFTFKKS